MEKEKDIFKSSIERLYNYEVLRRIEYQPFSNNGKNYLLSTYPYLDIVINDYCNRNCRFCVSNTVNGSHKLDIDSNKNKIEFAIKKLGVKEILLLGGEPTLRDDLPDFVRWLTQFNLNKICMTTNGIRLAEDDKYSKKLFSSGITNINVSLMTLDIDRQKYLSNSRKFISIKDLNLMKKLAEKYGVLFRINSQCFKDNNDSGSKIISFYEQIREHCHSVKFSPLLKTQAFKTKDDVTKFNDENTLPAERYDNIFKEVEDHYSDFPLIINNQIFGFVKHLLIFLETIIVLQYNQHNMIRSRLLNENKVMSFKLLADGSLSMSWNKDEPQWFINIKD